VRYVYLKDGVAGVFSAEPFYHSTRFDLSALLSATSFAALTYLGFDSVTTLAEDVKDPKRSVLLAAVLVVVFTGVSGGLLIYCAQIAWPD